MRTPSMIRPPALPKGLDVGLSAYLRQLQTLLELTMGAVYEDIRYGKSRFEIRTAAPNATQIEEGGIVFVDTGAARSIYTKLNGVVRSATIT